MKLVRVLDTHVEVVVQQENAMHLRKVNAIEDHHADFLTASLLAARKKLVLAMPFKKETVTEVILADSIMRHLKNKLLRVLLTTILTLTSLTKKEHAIDLRRVSALEVIVVAFRTVMPSLANQKERAITITIVDVLKQVYATTFNAAIVTVVMVAGTTMNLLSHLLGVLRSVFNTKEVNAQEVKVVAMPMLTHKHPHFRVVHLMIYYVL
jgi:hypothetical protein